MLRLPKMEKKKKKMWELIFFNPQIFNFQAKPLQAFHRKLRET